MADLPFQSAILDIGWELSNFSSKEQARPKAAPFSLLGNHMRNGGADSPGLKPFGMTTLLLEESIAQSR